MSHIVFDSRPTRRLPYRGRFAPSPTGPLHRGSLTAAMASWLDARAHQGSWLVRIEDIDLPRTVPGAAANILACLTALGFRWNTEHTENAQPVIQSQRTSLYRAAFERLKQAGQVYPCSCTRREIADSLFLRTSQSSATLQAGVDGALVYPGTCRTGLAIGRAPRAWRIRVDEELIGFTDRALGAQQQNLGSDVGDFILKRADGIWAYQLAVVVDDADQQITDIVRGADLLASTPRQIFLQRCLALPTPRYLHIPLVLNDQGEKLSKQTRANALNIHAPLDELRRAATHLQLGTIEADNIGQFWEQATERWAERHLSSI